MVRSLLPILFSEWLTQKIVQKVVVVVSSADNKEEVLERWQFDVETDQTVTADRLVAIFRVHMLLHLSLFVLHVGHRVHHGLQMFGSPGSKNHSFIA